MGIPTRKRRGDWTERAERRICVKCGEEFWAWRSRAQTETSMCAPCLFVSSNIYARRQVIEDGFEIPLKNYLVE